MLVVSELRAGTIFEDQGQLWQVLSYEHIKLGRGSATIKVKVKNLRTGTTTERGFINGAKVNDVSVVKTEMQYLYKDEDNAYFMHPDTFEQISVPLRIVEGDAYLQEGQAYPIALLGDEPLSIVMPSKVDLIVTETAPGVKGNSASNVFKDAVMENGITVKVPLFINVGDKIRVDTRTSSYTERA